jgi:hypothetical protein
MQGQTLRPINAPIAAVAAIANAPQKVTRIVGMTIAAPPIRAPIAPRPARQSNDPEDKSLSCTGRLRIVRDQQIMGTQYLSTIYLHSDPTKSCALN